MEKNVMIGILYEYYGELLTSKQSEAIEQYYFEDLSLTEIAEIQGVSKQSVSETIKRSEKSLLEFEQNLGLYKKISDLQILLENLDNNLKKNMSSEEYKKYESDINEIFGKLN